MSSGWEGMILLDKPQGPTSHDVVAAVRRTTGEKRIGHTGTLDPLATGLLLLLLGRATRLARFVPSTPKVYRGSMRFGVSTLTDDVTGATIHRHDGPLPDDDAVRLAASRLVGVSRQTPPAVSARKVGGERLYRAARRGASPEAPASRIEVGRFDVAPTLESEVWAFEASVSAGTFIRALVRDLGSSLGCGAAVVSLRRIAIGPLAVSEAVGWERLPPDVEDLARGLVRLDAMPLATLCLVLESDEERDRFLHGRTVSGRHLGDCEGPVAVRDAQGALLGIGRASAGILAPSTVLPPPRPKGWLPGPTAL